MERRELDPYEQQLLSVFESCDQDQSGRLDGNGLEQLCEKLQLEEQGIKLIKCLLGSSSSKKVTFAEFRDGLLTLLGEDQGERQKRREGDRGSPEREVSPKFVFGRKKYGRRSRPESTDQDLTIEEDENLEHANLKRSRPEASSLEDIKEQKTDIHSPVGRNGPCLQGCQKSGMAEVSLPSWQVTTEVSELCYEKAAPRLSHVAENEEECLRAAWKRLGVGKDGFLDRGELALLCECIGMQKVAEEVIQQLFEKLDVDRDGHISFDEFLLLFQSGRSLIQPNVTHIHTEDKSNRGSLGIDFQQCSGNTKERKTLGSSDQDLQFLALDTNSAGFVNVEVIVEIWEAAGVPGPSRLLQDLGFNDCRLNVADLAAVLEEELRSIANERRDDDAAGTSIHCYSPHEVLLQATLALYQTEVRWLKLSLEHMTGERDKLRADIQDANERASLLAQEVDDHHARLEKYSQLQVKLLEQQHAKQLKELSEQLGLDREHFAVQNLSLEKRVASLEEEESRLRMQVTSLQLDNEVLDKENHNLTEQLLKSEETRVQVQKELESLAGLQQRLGEMEGCDEKEQVLPLIEKVNELQAENTGLRDRNDELTMEVEALTAKLAALKTKKSLVIQPSCEAVDGVISVEGTRILSGGSATKRRGNLATEGNSDEESPRLEKMRRCCDSSGDNKDASVEAVNMEGLQIHHSESGVEADLGIDDYTDSGFGGEGQVRDHHCSEWDSREMLPLALESGLISDLKAHIENLEQELQLKSEKLVVCETERSRLKLNIAKSPHNVAAEEPDNEKSVKQLKGQLKQVFQLIQKQILEEFLEEDGNISALQESCSSHNQRTGQIALLERTDDGNMSTVASAPLLQTSVPLSINGITLDPIEKAKDVEQLGNHCRNLKFQSDLVNSKIVKIISENIACSKENCALKIHISDLKNHLPVDEVFRDVSSFRSSQNDPRFDISQEMSSLKEYTSDVAECIRTDYSDVAVKSVSGNQVKEVFFLNGIEMGEIKGGNDVHDLMEHDEKQIKELVTEEGDDSNDKEKLDLPEKLSEHSICARRSSSSSILQAEDLSKIWMREEETCAEEITVLRERCCQLESSLELLRQEYEKCEDYWANKLEEERLLYDQEQKLSDEKFSELMSKIREYEEMFGAQEDDSDMLSTIEERGSLEKQFTDLEEEFVEFRQKVELEQAGKEEELVRLREQLKTVEQQYKNTENKLNVAVQVSDLENGSWESDCKFVVELDGARKAIQHETESQRFSKARYSSGSSSPQKGPSTHCNHTELIHLHNLKEHLNEECHVLRHQKEVLEQEIMEIQTQNSHCQNAGVVLPPHWTSGAKVGGQACRIDLNILQALNSRLRQQEQQCHHLQVALKQQQQQSENILKRTMQEHKQKVAALQSALQTTQEKLNQQTSAYKEQMERLARTDILVKDLYVENAYLVANVQTLQQHCQVLVQMTSDSSSV